MFRAESASHNGKTDVYAEGGTPFEFNPGPRGLRYLPNRPQENYMADMLPRLFGTEKKEQQSDGNEGYGFMKGALCTLLLLRLKIILAFGTLFGAFLIILIYLALDHGPCNRKDCPVYGFPGIQLKASGTAYLANITRPMMVCDVLDPDNPFLALMNIHQFGEVSNSSSACNKCVRVRGPHGDSMAKVVGVCDTCNNGELALGKYIFDQIGPGLGSTLAVSWAPCESDMFY
ncbi:hypothetical protein H4219_001579 [Mycoemilia scoparia]|uniref:Uncharacterized protein n=1 Tax=Mycoemilia scoparia TaxID=417184 RepID=A0A9W8DVJ6_9FUNG|nr:hypothetical protein H4219_001579 [Mycoemilia scoparia]